MTNIERSRELTKAVVSILKDEFENSEVPSDLQDSIRLSIAECLGAEKRNWLTPPEVAAELRVSPDKILYWINSGELKAINVAKTQNGRARYRVERDAMKAFQKLRANNPPAPPTPRKKFKPPKDVIEFF